LALGVTADHLVGLTSEEAPASRFAELGITAEHVVPRSRVPESIWNLARERFQGFLTDVVQTELDMAELQRRLRAEQHDRGLTPAALDLFTPATDATDAFLREMV